MCLLTSALTGADGAILDGTLTYANLGLNRVANIQSSRARIFSRARGNQFHRF